MFCVSEAQAAVIRTAFEQRDCVGYFQALAMSRGLESASAPLRNGNRCWYAHRPCRGLSADGFRWNRSKNSKDWPYSSDCDCEISTVVGKTLWPFRKYTGGWRPTPRSFDARSGALGMVALESDATCVALHRWLRTTRFEPEAHTISDGQTHARRLTEIKVTRPASRWVSSVVDPG